MFNEIKDDTISKMDKSIDSLIYDFKAIRTGRASIALLDHVLVDSYGSKMPVNQLGNITIPEARTIIIDPWDKSTIQDIEKGISKSDLKLTPNNDGKVIRLTIPQLNEERRRDLVKQVKSRSEDGKIAIRNIRRDANEQVKKAEKDGHISQDDVKHGHDDIQKLTDQYIKKIDQLFESKEKEIMEI